MKSETGQRPRRILRPPVKSPFAEGNRGLGTTGGDERQRGKFLRHSGRNAGPAAPLAHFNIDSGGVALLAIRLAYSMQPRISRPGTDFPWSAAVISWDIWIKPNRRWRWAEKSWIPSLSTAMRLC